MLCTAGFCWQHSRQIAGPDQRITDLAAAEGQLYEDIYRTYHVEEAKKPTEVEIASDKTWTITAVSDADGRSRESSHENTYEDSYDYQKDPEWNRKCLKAQAQCRRLIDEYIAREGDNSVSVALLRDRLDRLYTWTGNRDAAVALHKEVKAVLNPTCPICHRGDALTMLSPDPHGLYQDFVKDGWWDCRRCRNKEPFQVDSRIKVQRTNTSAI
ncbi:MAG: hypothetical protein KC777_28540 [Cyanobacteria bacterium HKST-UBA02]|nr:hypothetical protein [Cyanobacteria bacterium HKST-UBA02]